MDDAESDEEEDSLVCSRSARDNQRGRFLDAN
jgi:hypothetical protein